MWKNLEQRFSSAGFNNEQLIYGHLGQFFILLSFFAVAFAIVSYITAMYAKDEYQKKQWIALARAAWLTHALSVVSIFVLLFIIFLIIFCLLLSLLLLFVVIIFLLLYYC